MRVAVRVERKKRQKEKYIVVETRHGGQFRGMRRGEEKNQRRDFEEI